METKKTIKIKEGPSETSLTAVIRISGMVKVNYNIENTLERLRLRKKYSCVLINTKEKAIKKLLEKVRFYVAYGEIDKPTLIELLNQRAKSTKGNKQELKMNTEKVADELISGKHLKDLGIKPFFRLHPPRKGIQSKLQYPKGVLGNNKKDINKLIKKML